MGTPAGQETLWNARNGCSLENGGVLSYRYAGKAM